jgi:RNA polymerase sigma-54 factor
MALSMGYGLVQEQRMKLAMTPELRQAIQVLQYSATELVQFLQDQALENPVLEVEGGCEAEVLAWVDYWRGGRVAAGGRMPEDSERRWESAPVAEGSLADELESQLRLMRVDPSMAQVIRYLIGNLDEQGYLVVEPEQICKRFNCNKGWVDACLDVLHGMEPAGVGARSLSECLRLQLARKPNPNPIALRIVEHHLADLAAGRYRQLANALDCDVESVQAAVDEIQALNPRPGLAYGKLDTHYIVPDVTVEEEDGTYRVSVNARGMPRLGISSHYERLLRRQDEDAKQALPYIKNRLQAAMWLMKSVEQRQQTLQRVAQAIVDEQQDFFTHGIAYLKPLTLKQVADTLQLHESTVSRATQHKTMQTPRGVFPFRYFFPSGVSTENGANTSAESVKNRIVQMIEGESKTVPLSDQRIAEQLQEKGVRISRRTVAKYREEMKIPSSRLRRRFSHRNS